MLLKGLSDSYKAFISVITQTRGDTKFSNFKTVLRSYEESENFRLNNACFSVNYDVMNVRAKYDLSENFKCFA